ncbi:hypothetical protein CVN86_24280 [Salmonella enterica]|nr:hypothetical protein [Salmonella enterica]
MKTALVFLAGPPDATNTTVSTDKSAANADNKETITVTLTPRDSHNNVVPLWTFRKDLTIVPSVNATVPGAVTVTTPAQDAAGAVTATLTYVDTSGQLLSKAARTGSTTVSIGSAVKKTFDTRFYPQVHVCLTNLDSNGYVTPGTTEVHLCDGSGHTIPSGSGYDVTVSDLSVAACPPGGGGVCPSDTAGVKADFLGLSGDDIRELASNRITFYIRDLLAGQESESMLEQGNIAFYGELWYHESATNIAATLDVFHVQDAASYCNALVRRRPGSGGGDGAALADAVTSAVAIGQPTGGKSPTDNKMITLRMGGISAAITTGGDTNPEIFVTGFGAGGISLAGSTISNEVMGDCVGCGQVKGATLPGGLVFVNGRRSASTRWTVITAERIPTVHPGVITRYP